MPAYPDVPDALGALRDAGFQLAVLTQSAARGRRGGDCATPVIRDAFELVLSAPALGAFKPDDLAYKAALERAGRDRGLVRRRTLVGRRGRRLRGAANRVGQPHRPRLPGRDARPGPHRRGRERGRRGDPSRSLTRLGCEQRARGGGHVLLEPLRERRVAADGGVRDVDDRAGDALDRPRVGAAGQAGDLLVDGGVEDRRVAVRVEQVAAAQRAAAAARPRGGCARTRSPTRPSPRPAPADRAASSQTAWKRSRARFQAAETRPSRLLKRW